MKNEKTVVDIDYAEAIVPKSARRGIVTMFMIMLGFTFFSASMWVGQQLADGLDFQGFVVSMIVGGVILSLYTGLFGLRGRRDGHEPRPSCPQGLWRQGFISALGHDLVHADRMVRRGHRHVCHPGRQ